MKPGLASNRSGCQGASDRQASRLTPYCKVRTWVGACSMRFCKMAPVVMHSSAASANSTPLSAKRETTRL
ncbi:hypothetical protein D3C87_2037710 [compost metagenome]